MSKKMDYFIFLLEAYASNKNQSAKDILRELDELELTELIIEMYERYHTEAIENAFNDIDRLIDKKRSFCEN